jgi:hypothetical protein
VEIVLSLRSCILHKSDIVKASKGSKSAEYKIYTFLPAKEWQALLLMIQLREFILIKMMNKAVVLK